MLIGSTVCAVLVLPYAFVVMGDVNKVLMYRAKGISDETTVPRASWVKTRDLIGQWAKMNTVRGFIPLVGVACAITALVW